MRPILSQMSRRASRAWKILRIFPSYGMVLATRMNESFQEPLKKKVGGSLSRISPLRRLEMLQKNALFLRGGKWQAPTDDGTFVRKVVGKTRKG